MIKEFETLKRNLNSPYLLDAPRGMADVVAIAAFHRNEDRRYRAAMDAILAMDNGPWRPAALQAMYDVSARHRHDADLIERFIAMKEVE